MSDNQLAALFSTAATVLGDGSLDADDIPALGSAGLGFLGVDVDAAGAAGQSPLGQLLQLVVSRIDFLAQPLAKLLGSAELVAQQSQDWLAVAQSFTDAGQDYAGGAADLANWSGSGAGEYRQIREAATRIFPAAAQGAQSMSVLVVRAGEMVAEVRAIIWDLLAEFLGNVISSALSALAAAVPSFGASIAAFAAWFLGSSASLAQRFVQMLQRLLKAAAEFGRVLGQEARKLQEAGTLMAQVQRGLATA